MIDDNFMQMPLESCKSVVHARGNQIDPADDRKINRIRRQIYWYRTSRHDSEWTNACLDSAGNVRIFALNSGLHDTRMEHDAKQGSADYPKQRA